MAPKRSRRTRWRPTRRRRAADDNGSDASDASSSSGSVQGVASPIENRAWHAQQSEQLKAMAASLWRGSYTELFAAERLAGGLAWAPMCDEKPKTRSPFSRNGFFVYNSRSGRWSPPLVSLVSLALVNHSEGRDQKLVPYKAQGQVLAIPAG